MSPPYELGLAERQRVEDLRCLCEPFLMNGVRRDLGMQAATNFPVISGADDERPFRLPMRCNHRRSSLYSARAARSFPFRPRCPLRVRRSLWLGGSLRLSELAPCAIRSVASVAFSWRSTASFWLMKTPSL